MGFGSSRLWVLDWTFCRKRKSSVGSHNAFPLTCIVLTSFIMSHIAMDGRAPTYITPGPKATNLDAYKQSPAFRISNTQPVFPIASSLSSVMFLICQPRTAQTPLIASTRSSATRRSSHLVRFISRTYHGCWVACELLDWAGVLSRWSM